MTDEKEFRSKVEDLVDNVKELRFPSSAGFKPFRHFFCEESVSHPAKANLYVLHYLIKKYTGEGEVVADPLSGTGSTGIVASYLGRHSVLVELEEKFVEWTNKNVGVLEKRGRKKGEIEVIRGDARKLSELLGVKADSIVTSPPYWDTKSDWDLKSKAAREGEAVAYKDEKGQPKENIGNIHQYGTGRDMGHKHGKQIKSPDLPPDLEKTRDVDAIITSPPYSDGFKHNPQDKEKRLQKLVEVDKRGVEKGQKWAVTSKEALERRLTQQDDGYGVSKDNIGNLPLGEMDGDVDAVITSPPYCGSAKGSDRKELWERMSDDPTSNRFGRKSHPHTAEGYSKSKENIGNLPHGDVDAIITSPPYEASVSDDKEGPSAGADEKKYGRWRKGTAKKQSYTQNGEPCKVDAIITSPPYESSLEGTTRHTKGGIASRDPRLTQSGTFATVMSFGVPVGYTPNKDNIGNLKSNEEEYKALEGKKVEGDPIDAIITSPPYAETTMKKEFENEEQLEKFAKEQYVFKHGRTLEATKRFIKKSCQGYPENPDNVGNLSLGEMDDREEPLSRKYSEVKDGKETYLGAMLRCYQQCYQVLKPNGRIIIIIKPFVRSKKAVDLPYHTWLLLERVGFKLAGVLKFRLPAQSFWRVLQYQKYPEIERINHEYIIIAQKP